MIEFGHGTHVGLRRDHNEDTYSAEPSLGLWLVADGMGGHEQGEVASAIARDTVVECVRDGESLDQAIRTAAARIIEYSIDRDADASLPMGTTLAAAVIDGDEFEVAWVGDSRVYQWDGEHLEQLTSDHSYVQELVDQGALGKLVMVESNMSSSQGWDLKPDEFRWRSDDTGCPGGSLMTIGVHQADTLNYIFGPIKTVFSMFRKLHVYAGPDHRHQAQEPKPLEI